MDLDYDQLREVKQRFFDCYKVMLLSRLFYSQTCIKRSPMGQRLVDWLIFCVFNATFSNISTISWLPVFVVEEAGENHQPWVNNW